MFVRWETCMYVCMYVCIHVFIHICAYTCMVCHTHIRRRSFLCSRWGTCIQGMYVCMYVCMHVCMYVCICAYIVYMYPCVCKYIHTVHTYAHTSTTQIWDWNLIGKNTFLGKVMIPVTSIHIHTDMHTYRYTHTHTTSHTHTHI
jgi:hypothetical protein